MSQYVYCESEVVWNGYGDVEPGALLRLPVEYGIGRAGASNRMWDRITVTRPDVARIEEVLAEAEFERMREGEVGKSSNFDFLYMLSAILFFMNQHPNQEVFELRGEAF